MSDVVSDFAGLFEGRTDAVGTETGGSQPTPTDWWHSTFTGSMWEQHLDGRRPIGVYPLMPHRLTTVKPSSNTSDMRWLVKWGCVDLDVKGAGQHKTGYESAAEAYTAACNLRSALKLWDVTSFVEITRSGGYHVWVFAENWVIAATMRRALLVACEVADVPPSEVNPKSEGFDDADTLGNYVRLPYPGWLGEGGVGAYRVVCDSDGETLTLTTFLADALESLTPVDTLERIAETYRPPVEVEVDFVAIADVDLLAATRKLSGLAYTIMQNPPLEGQDRSARLYKLACECKKSGLTASEACAVVRCADTLHGQKYIHRHDGQKRIETTVKRGYQ